MKDLREVYIPDLVVERGVDVFAETGESLTPEEIRGRVGGLVSIMVDFAVHNLNFEGPGNLRCVREAGDSLANTDIVKDVPWDDLLAKVAMVNALAVVANEDIEKESLDVALAVLRVLTWRAETLVPGLSKRVVWGDEGSPEKLPKRTPRDGAVSQILTILSGLIDFAIEDGESPTNEDLSSVREEIHFLEENPDAAPGQE
jgi:hypothetical protein